MFKVKAWIFTPQIVVCYAFLLAILICVISGKPATHLERDTDGVVREYSEPDDAYGTHTLTYRDMKEYQMEVTPHYVIVYDYDRIVGVLPLDNKCNLTKLIEDDNQ